jgi:hypothetical protein
MREKKGDEPERCRAASLETLEKAIEGKLRANHTKKEKKIKKENRQKHTRQ